MNIPQQEFDRIAREISSADSVVGIDARKTHVMILHLLEDIQQRLQRLEQRVNASTSPEAR